jgi:hypothetical protein
MDGWMDGIARQRGSGSIQLVSELGRPGQRICSPKAVQGNDCGTIFGHFRKNKLSSSRPQHDFAYANHERFPIMLTSTVPAPVGINNKKRYPIFNGLSIFNNGWHQIKFSNRSVEFSCCNISFAFNAMVYITERHLVSSTLQG